MSTDEMYATFLVILVMTGIVVWFFYELSQKNDLDETDIPSPPTIEELQAMTKAELIAYANQNGMVIRPSWTKAKLVEQILLQS